MCASSLDRCVPQSQPVTHRHQTFKSELPNFETWSALRKTSLDVSSVYFAIFKTRFCKNEKTGVSYFNALTHSPMSVPHSEPDSFQSQVTLFLINFGQRMHHLTIINICDSVETDLQTDNCCEFVVPDLTQLNGRLM